MTKTATVVEHECFSMYIHVLHFFLNNLSTKWSVKIKPAYMKNSKSSCQNFKTAKFKTILKWWDNKFVK
jgi:hypothetical protein